jgi:hypothetical protein
VQLLEKLITLLHWSKSLQNQMDKLSLKCLLSFFFLAWLSLLYIFVAFVSHHIS